MGNCFGSDRRGSSSQRQADNWGKTGIISLRDERHATLPAAALALAPTARVLDATNAQLKDIPPALGEFAKLERLVLASNQLTTLPSSICNLVKLRVLSLQVWWWVHTGGITAWAQLPRT